MELWIAGPEENTAREVRMFHLKETQLTIVLFALMTSSCAYRISEYQARPLPAKRASVEAAGRPLAPPRNIGVAEERLPKGVLARVRGKQGLIAVQEREGLRALTIDGVVQGAIRVGSEGDKILADPMVALVSSLAKPITSALVIGLGTGRTASELAMKVVKVEAVDLEPQVIAFARKYFGYQGHAAAADGLEYLRKTRKSYDLILMDAFSGRDPVARLVSKDAIKTMQQRLNANGVISIRLNQAPDGALLNGLLTRLPYTHVYGDGVGKERQNLYLVSSQNRGALNVKERSRLAVRPIKLPEILEEKNKLAVTSTPGAPPGTADISLIGYLIREKASGALALDLPHTEMGAIRYMLAGDEVAALAQLLPKNPLFPTQGAISSDGDTSKTLRPLPGGGGFMRSDVRHSMVAVALRGRARLLSVVHPDVPCFDNIRFRCSRLEPRIPWGGVLYELEITKVVGVLPLKQWTRMHARALSPILRRARRTIAGGDLELGSKALQEYLTKIESQLSTFGPMVRRLEGYGEASFLSTKLQKCCPGLVGRERTIQSAVTCDDLSQFSAWVNPDMKLVSASLRNCAERLYAYLSKEPDAPNASMAAARLVYLLEDRASDLPRKKAARLRARVQVLNKRFGGMLKPHRSVPEL